MQAVFAELQQRRKPVASVQHQRSYSAFGVHITVQEDVEGGVAGSVWNAVSCLVTLR